MATPLFDFLSLLELLKVVQSMTKDQGVSNMQRRARYRIRMSILKGQLAENELVQ